MPDGSSDAARVPSTPVLPARRAGHEPGDGSANDVTGPGVLASTRPLLSELLSRDVPFVPNFRDTSVPMHPDVRVVRDAVEAKQVRQGGFDPYGADPVSAQAEKALKSIFPGLRAVLWAGSGTGANVLAAAVGAGAVGNVYLPRGEHAFELECGAVSKATGLPMVPLPSHEGVLRAEDLRRAFEEEATSLPKFRNTLGKVVFQSIPTQYGAVPSLDQLRELSEAVPPGEGAWLVIDGARFGSAVAHDVDLLAIGGAQPLADALVLGVHKAGGELGSCVLLFDRARDAEPAHPSAHYLQLSRQLGQLIDASWKVSASALALFEDGLYVRNGKHANQMAARLASGVEGLDFLSLQHKPVVTNAVFVELPQISCEELKKAAVFDTWRENCSIHPGRGWAMNEARFVCSHATGPEHVDALIQALRDLDAQLHPPSPS